MSDLSPRGRLIRDAAIYTPVFLLCAGVLLLMLVGAIDRAVLGMVLLAGVTFLFGYQSIQSLRDLAESPREVNGTVVRRWTKRDGFVVKSHYISVERSIYRIPIEAYMDVRQQDTVHIVAYPHTGTVVVCERTARPEVEEAPKAGPAPAKGRMRTLRTARLTPGPRERRDPNAEPGSSKDE